MPLYLISLNVSGLPSWSAIFIGSLITLIIASDFFIKASERIGIALGIPAFIVGVTMIAIGTSLPELVTSIVAVTRGQSVIVPGNVVGSNLTNTGLVLGVIAIIAKQIKLEFDVMKVDGPMLIGATLLLFLCLLDGKFQFFEGLLFLGGLAVYLAYIFTLGRSGGDEAESLDLPNEEDKQPLSWKEPVILLLSGLVIYFSAVFNVQAINNLGKILNVGQDFIALTAVALGTSLPELIVSLVAVRTGNIEMAVGNVVGSNLFNIFAVMGLPRLFGEIAIPPTLIDYSLPALVAITLVLLYVLQDKVINRWEGWILLLFYIGVMVSLVSAEVIA
ncbi:MAG: calcium/sodium antiporter [Bacteroidota bacterium]